MTSPRLLRGLLLATAGLVATAAAALLAGMSFLGVYLRPTSDDWCALWKSRDMGVFGIVRHFYLDINGRVANAFANGLVNVDGLTGMKLFPALLVVSLGLGLLLVVRGLCVMLGRAVPWLVLVALVAVVEVLLFAAAPNPYQALLWAPGTISHTLPTVVAVWVVLSGMSAGRSPRSWVRLSALATAFVAGIFLATLSEPFMAMAGLVAGTSGALLIPRLRLARNWYPFTWCASACLGLIAGFAILYTSPGWERRQAQVGSASAPLSGGLLREAFQDWLRVADVVTSQWTYLAAFAVGLMAGLAMAKLRGNTSAGDGGDDVAAGSPQGRHPGHPRWMVAAIAVLPTLAVVVGSYLIVLFLRQGYGPSGWMYSRTWFNFIAPLVLILTGYGVWAGWATAVAVGHRGRAVATLVTLAAAIAAPAFSLYATATLVPDVQSLADATRTRSVAWDRQDERIRGEIARGATEVTYHPLYIGGLAEPFFTKTYAKDWAANCASKYYGVQKLNRPDAGG